MPWWDQGWHHQQMAIWWIIVVLIVLLVVLFVWRGQRVSRSGEGSPEEVLKRRYAKGEIDKNTYEDMLRQLRK